MQLPVLPPLHGEDGGSPKDLWNISILSQHSMMSQPRRPVKDHMEKGNRMHWRWEYLSKDVL